MANLEFSTRRMLLKNSQKEYFSLLQNENFTIAAKDHSRNFLYAMAYLQNGSKNFDVKKNFINETLNRQFEDLNQVAEGFANASYLGIAMVQSIANGTLYPLRKDYPDADISAVENKLNQLCALVGLTDKIVSKYAEVAQKKGISKTFTNYTERTVMRKIFASPEEYSNHYFNGFILPLEITPVYIHAKIINSGMDDVSKNIHKNLEQSIDVLDKLYRELNKEKIRSKTEFIFN
ncbi:MAG TPA: hypothetical protein VEC16_00720 [Alphaproteobacteria bacterium]|nr:hypothetical protein [Alphaproteobacteria bacterium]